MQGTMELQFCWIIKDGTQFSQKVDAKILNWKTIQEAAGKKKLSKMPPTSKAHMHIEHGKNEPDCFPQNSFLRRGLRGQCHLGNKALFVLPSAEPSASSVAQETELNCLSLLPPFPNLITFPTGHKTTGGLLPF